MQSTSRLHIRKRLELSLFKVKLFFLWYIYESILTTKYSCIVIVLIFCAVVLVCLRILFFKHYIVYLYE